MQSKDILAISISIQINKFFATGDFPSCPKLVTVVYTFVMYIFFKRPDFSIGVKNLASRDRLNGCK